MKEFAATMPEKDREEFERYVNLAKWTLDWMDTLIPAEEAEELINKHSSKY